MSVNQESEMLNNAWSPMHCNYRPKAQYNAKTISPGRIIYSPYKI